MSSGMAPAVQRGGRGVGSSYLLQATSTAEGIDMDDYSPA